MKKRLTLLIMAVILIFSGCAKKENTADTEKTPIIVASKIDTEGALLGNMILAVLEANGFPAVDKISFGPTDVIRRALINNEIDIYPEYTGNGAFFFDDASSGVWKDAKEGYERVRKLDAEKNGIIWYQPAPANNTWAIAVRGDLAESENLKTLEDLAGYINRGGAFKIAGSEEFASREDALPAFESVYGFTLSDSQLLLLAGGNTAQTEQAAARGTQGVNAAMAYGTDGQLSALGLVVLEDSLGVQPVYEPAPVVRREIQEKYPEIQDLLKPVFLSLDLVTLQTLNSSIAVEGKNAAEVAREYLKSKGFL